MTGRELIEFIMVNDLLDGDIFYGCPGHTIYPVDQLEKDEDGDLMIW